MLAQANIHPAMTQQHLRRKFKATPDSFQGSPPVNASNVARLAADLVRKGFNQTFFYQASARLVTMIPWGGDWTFSEDAHTNFKNMDQIVDYINAHADELNATIRYGTLEQYLDTVHGGRHLGRQGHGQEHGHEHEHEQPSNMVYPVVDGDFFVMDEECCQKEPGLKLWNCWSGYFSSFPGLKRALRKLDPVLRHAEMLCVLATGLVPSSVLDAWEAALGWGRHTQSIMTHHDAITGTGGGACNAEVRRLCWHEMDAAVALTGRRARMGMEEAGDSSSGGVRAACARARARVCVCVCVCVWGMNEREHRD